MMPHHHHHHYHGCLLLLLATAIIVIATAISLAESRQMSWQEAELRQKDERRATFSKKTKQKARGNKKPNIVLILTDDQDVELGSLNYMPKTLGLLRDGGAIFANAFVTTPMCCPSRSSILTGMYVHNHNVYTNNDNCSSIQWRENYESRNFATYLSKAGYRTGYFGKYLNDYQGDYIPPGWTEWMGLIRNSRFYNYKLNFNGQKISHADNYYKDYLTDLIANDSVTFLKTSKQYFPNRPVAMVLSFPAPHGPEDSAPQHQHLFANVTTHRTPSWNFAPNPDKQWLLQYTGKMEPIHVTFTDILHRKRLQTLQSVDDAVEKVFEELKELDELDNTYFLFTSDHGYHLGQYGMVKGKAMPYEFDIKVPFIMRGPSIPRGIRVPNIVLNVDIAPTLLGMAEVEPPEHMDGKSILTLFEGASKKGLMKQKKAWRDTFLVERGKITHKKIINRERLEAQHSDRLAEMKEKRVELACERPEYQPPCTANQQWECRHDDEGILRIFKCRRGQNDAAPPARCHCPSFKFDMDGISRQEMKRQRQFLKDYVDQPKLLKGQFVLKQSRLEVPDDLTDDGTADPSSSEVDDVDDEDEGAQWKGKDGERPWNTPGEVRRLGRVKEDPSDQSDGSLEDGMKRRKRETAVNPANHEVHCRVLPNNTVVCEEEVFQNFDSWKSEKSQLDSRIQQYKERLEELKEMRKHLKQQRPEGFLDSWTDSPLLPDIQTTSDNAEVDVGASLPLEGDELEQFFREDFVEEGEEEGEDGEDCNCDIVQDEEFNQSLKGKSKKSQIQSQKLGRREEIRRRRQEERDQKKLDREEKRDDKKDVKKESGGGGGSHEELKDVSQACNAPNMKCFEHNNDHWKTPPLWNLGPFCFCPNSNNNTYWCLRTINTTHNYLYCEFITGFISYYDMTRDPYQLRNAVHDLKYGLLQQLHNTLEKLKGCKGARECTLRTRPPEYGPITESSSGSGDLEGTGSGELELVIDEGVDNNNVFSYEAENSGDVDNDDAAAAKADKEQFLWLTDQLRLDVPDDFR